MYRSILATYLLMGVFTGFLQAQNENYSYSNAWGLEIATGAQSHSFFSERFLYTLCIEGCTPIEQTGKWSSHFAASLFRQFAGRHYLKLGYFTHRRILKEKLEDTWFGGIFDVTSKNKYNGIVAGYQFNFLHKDKVQLFVENGLLTEWVKEQTSALESPALSYTGKLGLDYFPWTGRIGFSLQAFVLLPLSDYSPYQFEGFGTYKPYAVGISTGAKVKL